MMRKEENNIPGGGPVCFGLVDPDVADFIAAFIIDWISRGPAGVAAGVAFAAGFAPTAALTAKFMADWIAAGSIAELDFAGAGATAFTTDGKAALIADWTAFWISA